MADGYVCTACSKVVSATKNNRYRSHKAESGDACEMSSVEIPNHLLEQAPSDTKAAGVPEAGKDFSKCPHCTRAVKLTRLGYFESHDMTLRGGDRCPNSGVRFRPLKPTEDIPLPGDGAPGKSLYQATHPRVSAQMEVERERIGVPRSAPVAGSGASTDSTSPGSTTSSSTDELPDGVTPVEILSPGSTSTSESSETSSDGNEPSDTLTSSPGLLVELRLGSRISELFLQPASPFLQPPEYKEPPLVFLQPPEYTGPEKPGEMTPYAKEVATRIKETFYSYSNRKSSDNRSAQTTLGPSEIGTPCDRRLAMALMNIPPVNPGGDGWAAFVGTWGHVGMGEVYKFADAGTGRYVVEMPVFLGIPSVPRGTTDLLDRRYGDITDWKFMGAYSLKKFKLEGPSDTYRIQAQVYGLGAERAGEKVNKVVIVALPRAGGSLDDMWIWEEKYDRKVGRAALDRVQKIADQVALSHTDAGLDPQELVMRVAKRFPTADDCRYCDFHLKNDKEMTRGCPGS
jgi:hypothetical protein